MHFAKQILLLTAVVMIAASAVQAEEIDNPEYAKWKDFKAGAMTKAETVAKVGGNETKMTLTTTLKSINEKAAVISQQTTMVVGGNPMTMPAQERTISAKIEKPEMPEGYEPPEVKTETGEETLKIGDKEVKCKWVKTTMEVNGQTMSSKIWTSESVPGHEVKMEGGTGAMSSSRTVVEFKTGG